MSEIDHPIIDCHCHIFNPGAYPYAPDTRYCPQGHEIGTDQLLSNLFAAHNVQHAVLVQPNSGYEFDNAYLLHALKKSGGNWRGIAIVNHDCSLEELAQLKLQGIVGVAFNLTFYPAGYYRKWDGLIKRLAELGMIIHFQVEGDRIFEFLPLIENIDAQLVIDHCGRPLVTHGIQQPGFQELLKLGRERQVVVKISGHHKFSAIAHPYEDTRPFTDALIEAFGPQQCIWGSDWPYLRVSQRIDYGPQIGLIKSLFPKAEDFRQVLWDTPRQIFGF